MASRPVALVVDQDPVTHDALTKLAELGFEPVAVRSGAEALVMIHELPAAVVLLQYDLPDITGDRLLDHLQATDGDIPIVVLTSDVRKAFAATRSGAAAVLDPSRLDDLRTVVPALQAWRGRPGGAARSAGPRTRESAEFFDLYEQLFHRSEKMQAIERLVRQVADTRATVLIQGETGTGKELIAKAIHYLSDRSSKAFLKVNCASLAADLLESELFGHEKGAFTGALSRKPGRFELAHGGTFLLDEIGEMPLSLQSKILHVLQDNEFFRVGGRELISVDVRMIAATNKPVQKMAIAGSFREDLYYRLNVVNIVVPPLRERREEIVSHVDYFRGKFLGQFHRIAPPLSAETRKLLVAYGWPGNVRELENLIKRYVVLADEAQLRDELKLRIQFAAPLAVPAAPGETAGMHLGLREIARRAAREAERAVLQEVLERVRWNRAEAARVLKMSYKGLLYKLKQDGIAEKLPGGPRHDSALPKVDNEVA